MCKVYGYCRVSTKQQSIDRQERNIKGEYPSAIILKEAFTGTKVEGRKEFEKLLRIVKAGDTIVFDSVSRMSRDAEQGIELYERLYSDGVKLVFLKEQTINTEVYDKVLNEGVPLTGTDVDLILKGVNEYLKVLRRNQIKQAFDQAQKEVDDLHVKTSEGLDTARLNGKQIGQKQGAKLNVKKAEPAKEQIRKYSRAFDGNLKDSEVIKLVGIAPNTYYKYKRELTEGR